MLFVLCSFIIATGQPRCITETPINAVDAIAISIAVNRNFPYVPGHIQTPFTIWPADQLPKAPGEAERK